MKVSDCVGCGFCCIEAKCMASLRLGGLGNHRCNYLEWSPFRNRYICRLMELEGELGRIYRKELHAGAGCCSNLNSWRKDVKNRDKPEGKTTEIDPDFQVFLHCIGREFLSKDVVYLALMNFKKTLLDSGRSESEVLNVTTLVAHYIGGEKSSFMESFMG